MDHRGKQMVIISKAYKDYIGKTQDVPAGLSIYMIVQASQGNHWLYWGGYSRPQCSTTLSAKCLPAISVPTLRSKSMPKLSANFSRQDACQTKKIFAGVYRPGDK